METKSINIRKILLMVICLLLVTNISTLAKPAKRGPIFMGKVLEVMKDENQNTVRILVRGYIKGCEVYEEELVAIINEETEIIKSTCVKDDTNRVNINYKSLIVNKGDNVFIVLSEAMTKSIPPQSVAKAIQISKVPK